MGSGRGPVAVLCGSGCVRAGVLLCRKDWAAGPELETLRAQDSRAPPSLAVWRPSLMSLGALPRPPYLGNCTELSSPCPHCLLGSPGQHLHTRLGANPQKPIELKGADGRWHRPATRPLACSGLPGTAVPEAPAQAVFELSPGPGAGHFEGQPASFTTRLPVDLWTESGPMRQASWGARTVMSRLRLAAGPTCQTPRRRWQLLPRSLFAALADAV